MTFKMREEAREISLSNLATAVEIQLLRPLGFIKEHEHLEIEFPWRVTQIPLKLKIYSEEGGDQILHNGHRKKKE